MLLRNLFGHKRLFAMSIGILLSISFFYEGIYKLTDLRMYCIWLFYFPHVLYHARIVGYSLPILELLISFLLLIPRTRLIAFHLVFWTHVALLIYIFYSINHHILVLPPYQAFWPNPSWTEKSRYLMIVAWLAFSGILVSSSYQTKKNNIRQNDLRNKTPADVSRKRSPAA
jgi:uncharacterized membrane protein YphA (DoxX/SURF4 family)